MRRCDDSHLMTVSCFWMIRLGQNLACDQRFAQKNLGELEGVLP